MHSKTHTHVVLLLGLAASLVPSFAVAGKQGICKGGGDPGHANTVDARTHTSDENDLHAAGVYDDGCEYENGERVDERPHPVGLEVSLEAFGHPSEGYISVFYGLFDESGRLVDRCGSSHTECKCDLAFSVGDKGTPPTPLLHPGDLLVSGNPGDRSASFVRNQNFYFGKLERGWHTLFLAVTDIQGHTIATTSASFEWDPPPALPLDDMESALLKLSEQPPMDDGSPHSPCSSVHKLTWSGFECSLPRAVMRAFELRHVQVTPNAPQTHALEHSAAALLDHHMVGCTTRAVSVQRHACRACLHVRVWQICTMVFITCACSFEVFCV
jgi:hypothetical protein